MLLEGYGSASLTFRMLCAVESAARNHPDLPVFLLMTSPVVDDSSLLQDLRASLRNLHLAHLDTPRLFRESPLEAWHSLRAWEGSKWPTSHYNDALRWLLLWRYGGLYLDLDVVVTHSLTHLYNCTGLESGKWVAAGVLKFSAAHPVILSCLEHFAAHFDGQVWGANGPELLTQVLVDRCGLELPSGRTPKCPDVSVLPPRAFYPVPWWEWKRYVTDDPELSSDLLSDPQVMVLHVWNLHTRHALVRLASHMPYARAAHAHCPTTTAHAGDAM
ncbi:Lactosylceramide 4-alpha-galactosyltransferase [Chionoecetes opilio]|uniref:Lactosylceramide 4-alpha-galactosyltransferase n=1 Tax=Chionoecetes opilio TaxID=41210 RepID=A0A8J5D2E5_CHIOP|nr:Lactosylceramide 4-alpha-galactosyltransferase [Chionoecetes opilio]